MNFHVEQVGKRWYKVFISEKGKPSTCVEVMRHDGGWWNNYERTYTMTGTGSKKYREEISARMDHFIGKVEKPAWMSEVDHV